MPSANHMARSNAQTSKTCSFALVCAVLCCAAGGPNHTCHTGTETVAPCGIQHRSTNLLLLFETACMTRIFQKTALPQPCTPSLIKPTTAVGLGNMTLVCCWAASGTFLQVMLQLLNKDSLWSPNAYSHTSNHCQNFSKTLLLHQTAALRVLPGAHHSGEKHRCLPACLPVGWPQTVCTKASGTLSVSSATLSTLPSGTAQAASPPALPPAASITPTCKPC